MGRVRSDEIACGRMESHGSVCDQGRLDGIGGGWGGLGEIGVRSHPMASCLQGQRTLAPLKKPAPVLPLPC